MKKSELRQLIREEIQKTMLVDRIYNALSEIDEFKQLGMDQQGELVTQIEDLFTEYDLNESEFDKAMDKFKEKVGIKPTTSKNVMREKEYEVEYWFRFGKSGDEKDNDVIKVMAPVNASDDEIIKRAKEEARRNYINSSFKVKR